MMNLGQFPVPKSYPATAEPSDAAAKLMYFSDEALLFIFYMHAKDKMQEAAVKENKKIQ